MLQSQADYVKEKCSLIWVSKRGGANYYLWHFVQNFMITKMMEKIIYYYCNKVFFSKSCCQLSGISGHHEVLDEYQEDIYLENTLNI